LLYLLYTLFFASCIVLVGAVLLQPGKTDAGALFTSNISSASLGPRGTASVLSKITIAAAAIFMVSALLIAMPGISGDFSVLQSVSQEPATAPANTNAEVPAADANTNVTAPAADENAAPATDANTAPADETAPAANTAANETK
jgi:protein translocase SecG subunit